MSFPEDEEVAEAPAPYEFDAAFQRKIAGHVVRDEMFMRRACDLIRKEHFEDEGLQWLVGYAADHYRRFEQTPSAEIVINDVKALKASGRMKAELLDVVIPQLKFIFGPTCDLSNRDYMVEQVARFAKKQAFEAAILKAAEMIDSGDHYDEAAKLIEDARQVGSIDEGVGYEFWSSAEERTEARIERLRTGKKNGVTTGVKELDDALAEGGWGRGELSILMGPPKSGKSIGLGEFGINASLAGHNVLYLSLENSARIVGDRMDANASETRMRDLASTPAGVRSSVTAKGATAGKLWIHEFPTGMMRPSDIRRLIRKYQSQGYVIDLVVIDYADIMAPDFKTGAENTDSKQIYTMIRAIGQQENCAILTATQTNRDGAKATVAKFTDVSEDINRVRLADVFIILAATDAEKADDVFRLYMAAMRNSESGVMFSCRSDRARMKFIKKIEKAAL
jgi:replicative DNA helicase